MKVETQNSVFKPVVITLESFEELDDVTTALDYFDTEIEHMVDLTNRLAKLRRKYLESQSQCT